MAITTFSELKTAVGSWLHRDDLTTQIPDFIALAEAQLNRRLRVRSQVTTTTLSATARTVALPADYLELKSLDISASPRVKLKAVSLEQSDLYDLGATTGEPRIFAISGANLVLAPTPQSTYTLNIVYYAKIPALSDVATTNWLLTAHPDIYLYGALRQAAAFMLDDARVPAWVAAQEQAITELEQLSEYAEYSGTAIRVRFDDGA